MNGCLTNSTMNSVQVLLRWVFTMSDSARDNHKYLQAVGNLQILLRDVLMELPLSSVQVEKKHASLQHNSGHHKQHPWKPRAIQMSSYIMSAVQEHASLKSHVERECFGSKHKASRLLKAREVSSSQPTSLSLRKVPLAAHRDTERSGQGFVKKNMPLVADLLYGVYGVFSIMIFIFLLLVYLFIY